MKDAIDIKLSSIEDKIHKKAFIRSNKFSRSCTLVLSLAVRQDFVSFFCIDDERIVVASLDTIVDLDIPILQRCPHCFNLTLDALLDRRKYHPRVRVGELAHRPALLHENAQILYTIFVYMES